MVVSIWYLVDRGERDPAHIELLAALLGKLHAVGLQSIQGFQAWAKGVPIKSREGSLSERVWSLGSNRWHWEDSRRRQL